MSLLDKLIQLGEEKRWEEGEFKFVKFTTGNEVSLFGSTQAH